MKLTLDIYIYQHYEIQIHFKIQIHKKRRTKERGKDASEIGER